MKKETWFCIVFSVCAFLIWMVLAAKPTLFPTQFSHMPKEQRHQQPIRNHAGTSTSEDPRLAYKGPFQNIHPDVKTIGSEKCANCHPKIAATYSKHPMARTLTAIADLAQSLPFDQAHKNPFQAFESQFRVERRDGRVWNRQTRNDEQGKQIFQIDMEVHYAIGSGSHGHSFVCNRDGYLFQTTISWFSQEKKWGLSPGFGNQRSSGRAIIPKCFFCHANQALPLEGFENRYQPPIFNGLGIGCERCHGPGEKHNQSPGRFTRVTKEEAEASPYLAADVRAVDTTIVHPGKLRAPLREAICQQCHLAGEERVLPRGRKLYDFRPGLPLESCWSVFVESRDAGADKKAVNHVEQMVSSRCFQRSQKAKKLGCISCHDAHQQVGPDRKAIYYRKRCLNCHQGPDAAICSMPVEKRLQESKEDSCVQCHMPAYRASDIVHNASTNHRIIRRPEKEDRSPKALPSGSISLVLFHQGPVKVQDRERTRDLGIALANLAVRKRAGRDDIQKAIRLLEEALRPDDLEAWAQKARLLFFLGRRPQALAAAESILEKQPNHEIALAQAGALSEDVDKALSYWRRAVALNPWIPQYHAGVAQASAQLGNWKEASQECQAWLSLDPASIDARKLRIECLLQERKISEARAEFDRIMALKPPNHEDLKSWFTKQTK